MGDSASDSRHDNPGPRRVAQKSVVELVIDEVRRSILEGSLPVREALRRLEGEGLIELRRPRSGVVASVTPEGLDHVFHLRALIEGDMMARAVKRYTDADLEKLEAAYRALERRPNDRHPRGSLGAPHGLSSPAYEAAASRWDWRLYEILWQAGERYVYLILGSTMLDGRPTHFRDVHTDLLEAALSRSVRLARKAVSDHLRAGVERVGAELGPPRQTATP